MTHLRALLILLALNLLFFHSLVLNPGHILYSDHSDLIAEHIPAKRFLVRSYQQTGELPLWCPHMFAGSPFVHDIQVAMFYPPHLLLLLMPEEAVGPALSWFVVLHVLLAGWLMYAYAVHRGLTGAAALVAAMGFMFGGRWLMHLLGGGHYILIGLAWLPLVLLGWERAVLQRRFAWGLLAGISFALLTLSTQPQWTFYSGIFAALWTFGVVLEAKENRRTVPLSWLTYGVLIVTLTVGLTAIQLLPTLEAAGQSSRAGGVGYEGILAGGLRVLLFLVGPPISNEPYNLAWEDRGGLGLVSLIAVVWAPILCKGRTRYEAGVCLALFLFAMGGAALLQPLPGFSMFRQPARMVVVAMFPVAFLAATVLQRLTGTEELTPQQRATCQRWFIRIHVAIGILIVGMAIRIGIVEEKTILFPCLNYLLLGSSMALWFFVTHLYRRDEYRATRGFHFIGPMYFTIDLLCVLVATIPTSESSAELTQAPPAVNYVAEQRGERTRTLDRDQIEGEKFKGSPFGSGAPLAVLFGIDAVRGYSPLDVARYREYLMLIADSSEPLRALSNTVSYPVIGNFPLTNRRLVDLLNVRFVIALSSDTPPGDHWKMVSDDLMRAELMTKVYDFISGGAYFSSSLKVWVNEQCLPRTFVVPTAKPLPERSAILETFKNADFRKVVYLEDYTEEPQHSDAGHTARILDYQPNRVRIAVDGKSPGFLFLGDVWFPGWTASVNGEPAKVYRANYTFRAIKIPAGESVVEFRFEPQSYFRGRRITLVTLALTVGLTLLVGVAALLRQRKSTIPPTPEPQP